MLCHTRALENNYFVLIICVVERIDCGSSRFTGEPLFDLIEDAIDPGAIGGGCIRVVGGQVNTKKKERQNILHESTNDLVKTQNRS